MKIHDGVITQGLEVWQSGRQVVDVSCGLSIVSPALANAPVPYLTQLEDEVRAKLQNLSADERLQFRWSQNGDFGSPLMSYFDHTEAHSSNEWSQHQRNAKFIHLELVEKKIRLDWFSMLIQEKR